MSEERIERLAEDARSAKREQAAFKELMDNDPIVLLRREDLQKARGSLDSAEVGYRQNIAFEKKRENEIKAEIKPLMLERPDRAQFKNEQGYVQVRKIKRSVKIDADRLVSLIEEDPEGHYQWLREYVEIGEEDYTVVIG